MCVYSNLNSLLVEGTLEGNPVLSKGGAVSFTVLSHRVIKNKTSGKLKEETTRIGVIAVDIEEEDGSTKPLVKVCMENCKKGRGVRVVGRLAERKTGGLCVTAEHVELRPEFKKARFS